MFFSAKACLSMDYEGSTLTLKTACAVGQVGANFTCPNLKSTCPDH